MMIKKLNLLLYIIGFLFMNVINLLSGSRGLISSYNYRILSSLISLLVLILVFHRQKRDLKVLIKDPLFISYLIFSILYLSRRFYDLYIAQVSWPGFESPLIEMIISIVFIFIMPLSLISILRINLTHFSKYFYWIFSSLFLLNAIFNTTHFGIVAERSSSLESLGVQSLGFYAALLFILSIILFLKSTSSFNLYKSFYLIGSFVSLFYLAMAGTRSVTLGVIVIVLTYLIVNIKQYLTKQIFSLFTLVILIYLSLPYWGSWFDILILRFERGFSSGTTGRQNYWPKAIDMFISSPLLGNYHIIPNQGYFHNYLLDAFVSTGILGGILFTILNFKAIKVSIKWMNSKYSFEYQFISSFYILSFIFGMFSGSIYLSAFYWGSLMLVLLFNRKGYNLNSKHSHSTKFFK